MSETNAKPTKKFYKRWWFWLLVVFIIFVLASQGNKSSDSKDSSSSKTKTEKTSKDNVSVEYQNAYEKAKSYMDMQGFSKDGLYEQLTSKSGEGFKPDAAKYAVNKFTDNDYKKSAVKSAKTYSKDMNMSANGVYDQLTSNAGDKYTPEQAKYAINKLHLGAVTNTSGDDDSTTDNTDN
ncbi:Ltp family lipoprotein [Fructilactobacillus sp. Tb1]|uniref:Ltp family lipoprotein n=1 Tax=Fructilactobacillus sp. Tb1 TaxID=3422304 RepID=UPI003D2A3FF3